MPESDVSYAEHREGLFRYLCRAVGHEAAPDVTQDVFVRALSSSRRPATDGEQRVWLFSIARNLAIDHHRRRQIRDAADPVVDRRSSGSAETSVIVQQALEQLEPVDRDLFLLREVSGLGYAELAAACALTPDAVRSRLHRARVQLREWLRADLAERRLRSLRLEPNLLGKRRRDP